MLAFLAGEYFFFVNLKFILSGDLSSCDFFFILEINSLSRLFTLKEVQALDQVLWPLTGLPTA